MNWPAIVALGACGGAVVQVVALSARINTWQEARRAALTARQSFLPKLTWYIDPASEGLVLLTRLVLGGLAGGLFHTQVTGATAAIAVGASAPALLRSFGASRTITGLSDASGTESTANTSKPPADLGPLHTEDE